MLGKGRRSSLNTAPVSMGFNEARAVCSGKVRRSSGWAIRSTGFNEARAVCSGKGHWDAPHYGTVVLLQ